MNTFQVKKKMMFFDCIGQILKDGALDEDSVALLGKLNCE